MAARRDKPFTIRRPDQMKALTSPVRQELVDGVQAIGPCSIAQLADLLGRAPDALYYHVRKLESVGLMLPQGQIKAGRRDAAVYDVPGRPISIDQEIGRKRSLGTMVRSITSMLRLTERDLKTALDSGWSLDRNSRRHVRAGRAKGWITKAQLAEANRHIAALETLLATSRKRKGHRLVAFTYALTPMEPGPGLNNDTNA